MIAPVIQYHKIDKPGKGALVRGGYTPPRRFVREMTYLKRAGFRFFKASELIEHFRQHNAFPTRGISVTFDDGWEDNYRNAFPVLKALGIGATIFLIPSCLGQRSAKALAEGESPRFHLSREQVIEMSAAGIEFGSHSHNHRLLHQLGETEIRSEVEEAKREIEELTQKPCKTFAYPAGFYTEVAQQIISKAGHIAAFSTTYGPTDRIDLFALNRVEIRRRDRFAFQFRRKIQSIL